MVKRKRLKKHQIKQDSFVTFSLKASNFAKEHFNQIIISIIAICAIIVFLLFTSHARRQAALEGERLVAHALETYRRADVEAAEKEFTQIAEQYSQVKAGLIALYFKAECNLRLTNFSEAMSSYETYIRKSGKFPLFKDAAIIGKAMALEGAGNYATAARLLENLLKQIDKDDPRYLDIVYRTAIFYSKVSGQQAKARKYFNEVAKKATGRMKEQARVAAEVLESSS